MKSLSSPAGGSARPVFAGFPGMTEEKGGMDSTGAPAAAEPMPLGLRLMNVFAAPAEVFASVAAGRFSLANWLVPAAIVGTIGLIFMQILFSQPAMVEEIGRMQERELQKQVEKGKITEAQADQARTAMRGLGLVLARVSASVVSVVGAICSPLWWGLLAWITVRVVFRASAPYMRCVEVAGLASLIGGLSMVVGTLLAMGTGRIFAGPHLGFFVTDFDMAHRGHLALGAVNVFGLWQMGVLSLGMARLIGRPFATVATVLFGVWLGYKGLAVVLRLAQFAL